MKSGYTVQKLLEEFWLPSSSIFNKAIELIPDRQAKDIEGKLKQALIQYNEVSLNASIQSLATLKETRLNELDEVWLDAIEEATSTIPELLILAQNETHFEQREGDTLVISIGKSAKKIRRALRKTGHAVQNVFRRIFRKPETDFEVAKREVPFKNMAREHLFELKMEISEWKHVQYRFSARVFEASQKWVLSEGVIEAEENETSFEKLITNLTRTYQEESAICKASLEEKFEIIKHRLAHNLELVGTIELSTEKYSDEHIEKAKKEFTGTLNKSSENWGELIDSLSQRVELLLTVMGFKNKIYVYTSSFLNKIDDLFQQALFDPHQYLKEVIEQSITELKQLSGASKKELTEIGNSIHTRVKEEITKNISDSLTRMIEQRYISGLLDEFIGEMTGFAKDQPEKSVIIEDIDIESAKPVYDIREIEWQKFVQRMLGKYIATELDARKLIIEEKLEEIGESYLEVLQIIETNLVVVDEVSRKEEEKPIDVALQGLERSLNKIEEIEQELFKAREVIPDKVNTQNKELIDKLSGFLIKQDVSEMKWMDAQLKVKESAGDWSTKVTVGWARFIDRLDLLQRFLVQKYRKNEQAIRIFLGLNKTVSQSIESTNLATFLYETDRKYEDLPFIYRRLFDFHREVEPNFFIQNPLCFESCRKALELWKGGFPASISLIGEKGSGKSTLVRFLNEEVFSDSKSFSLQFTRTYWQQNDLIKEIKNSLKIPKADTIEELVSAIKKNKKGNVVFVENLQNTYVRNMSGYEAIKALLYIISETKKEVFWVITCSRYAWNFLDVVFRVGDYFSHSVATDKLNADEIESLILKRQKASGYQLLFIPDASTEKSRAYKKFLDNEEEAQRHLKEKYFQKLTNLAEGNATVAMILWIRSIKEFNESHFTIESLDIINTASLDGLDSLSLFALSAFILHDALTADELAMVLNDTQSNCEMTISRLYAKGLLVGEKKYYELNDLIYRQVVRLLKNRNILH